MNLVSDSDVLTIDETAQYLRVHSSTIRRRIEEGSLPAFRVGSAWRLRKEAIDRWALEQQESLKSNSDQHTLGFK